MKPNLPSEKVKLCIVSAKEREIISALENLKVKCIPMNPAEGYIASVGSHPDLFYLPIGNKVFVAENADRNVTKALTANGLEIVSVGNITEGYPTETRLNIAVVGQNIICCRKNSVKSVIDYLESLGYTVINQRQGYARCSVCIVDSESIITSDKGIYDSVKDKMNALLVSSGNIHLEGYACGFIGGASMKFSDDKLAFFGRIEEHPDYLRICDFCRCRGVAVVSLVDSPLRDIGGTVLLR